MKLRTKRVLNYRRIDQDPAPPPMIDKRLGTRLRSLIRQYGIEQIDQSLWDYQG